MESTEQKYEPYVFHNVERFPQPNPNRNPGGDCFACALYAAVRWMYPDKHPTFDEVWECFQIEKDDGTPYLANAWHNYKNTFRNLSDLGYSFEYKADMYKPSFDPEHSNYSFYHEYSTNLVSMKDTAELVRRYILDGYILYVGIDMEGNGPIVNGQLNASDHIVLVDGYRKYTKWLEQFDYKAGTIIDELHVVCSAKEENNNWRSLHDLIHKYGFAGFWALRKTSP